MIKKNTIGYWILLIVGLFILVMLFLGQMMSFINYEFTVSLGLQEPVEQIGEFGVAVNKGFGVGDTIIYIPILLAGIIGIWQNKKWGIWLMFAALGITAYWPVVCLSIILFSENGPNVQFNDIHEYIFILTCISLYGLWGMWYLYNKQIKC